MRIYHLLLVGFVCVFYYPQKTEAQQLPAYELLPSSDWNYDYLNALIRQGIDSVRQLHGAVPLGNNQILFDAALHHARYLKERKILSHYQKEYIEFRAPHDRVLHFGGKAFSMSGENVALTYALTKVQDKDGTGAHTNLTYSRIAYDFVQMWVHSPGHFRNIITKEYNQTGIATIYDSADHSVRAVQVFGTMATESPSASDFEFDFQKMRKDSTKAEVLNSLVPLPPHADHHDWKIVDGRYDRKLCASCFHSSRFIDLTDLDVKGRDVWLYTTDIENIKGILQGHHDGFALEFVTYTPFDCRNHQYYSNLSRRNGGCIFNGRTSEPVLGKEAASGFVKVKVSDEESNAGPDQNRDKKRQKKPGLFKQIKNFLFPEYKLLYYHKKLGSIPDGISGYMEINLLELKKNKLCHIVHFTGLCGEKMSFSPEFRDIQPNFTKPWSAPTIFKKFSIRLPFEKNKYDATANLFTQQLSAVKKVCDKIDSVSIMAFSSVEGERHINEELQLKRAEAIAGIIRASQMDTLISRIRTGENWDMMHQQIRSTRKLDLLKNKSDEEIEEFVNEEKNLPLTEPFLRLQRYAQIELSGTRTEKAIPDLNWINKKASRYVAEIKKSKGEYTATAYRDSLRDLQTYIFQAVQKKEGRIELLEKLKIPDNSLFTEFLFQNLWSQHYFSALPGRQKDSILFRALLAPALRNEGYFSPRYTRIKLGMQHNFLRFRGHKEIQGHLKDCRNLLNSAPDTLRENIRQYLLAMHMKAIDYYTAEPYSFRNFRYESIKYVYDYWKSRTDISDSLALQIGNYLISQNALAFARQFLFPYALKENPMPELLMQAIKLSYTHPDDELDFDSFRQFLLQSRKHLSREQWCGMFTGPCNISFQVWDDPEIRDFYCEDCAGKENYAESIFDPIPD